MNLHVCVQVRNGFKQAKQRVRLSRDALYNLIELSHDIDFINHIVVHPDLIVLMYSPTFVEIFRSTLSRDLPVQQLSYDTTFTLGDFYLSVILFRETEFISGPVMPLPFMLHERKTQGTHEVFFRHLVSLVPGLNSVANCIIITDNELAITNAISVNLPDLPHFLCSNHIMQDAKRWLRDHGCQSAAEITYYVDCMRTLFASSTEDVYKEDLIKYFTKWSQPFSQWFTEHVHPVIGKLGKWRLEEYDLQQATTNQSESFNFVVKQLQVYIFI